jgi:hypothetical protein
VGGWVHRIVPTSKERLQGHSDGEQDLMTAAGGTCVVPREGAPGGTVPYGTVRQAGGGYSLGSGVDRGRPGRFAWPGQPPGRGQYGSGVDPSEGCIRNRGP